MCPVSMLTYLYLLLHPGTSATVHVIAVLALSGMVGVWFRTTSPDLSGNRKRSTALGYCSQYTCYSTVGCPGTGVERETVRLGACKDGTVEF